MTIALATYLGLTTIAAPGLIARAKRDLPQGRRRERAGVPSVSPTPGLTWVSAASVGELRAVLPLLPELGPVLVTTQTSTAAALAEAEGLLHQFTPVDTPAATTAFLRNWKPRAAIFVESECPPRMIGRLRQAGIPSALIGARASKTRARLPKTMGRLLSHLTVITAGTRPVADDLRALGLTVHVIEDLKAAAPTDPITPDALAPWADIAKRPIWLAASTHDGDEAAAMTAHTNLLQSHPDALLLLAPRHPERFEAVSNTLPAPITRQSQGQLPHDTSVHLIDQMGTLPLFYTLAPVTFLGGSFATLGGHSPFEPARYASHVITGSDVAHHRAAYDAVPHITTTASDLAAHVRACWAKPRPTPFVPKPAVKTAAALLQMIHTVAR